MMATRLYQNTARVHFNLHAEKDGRFGRRIIFGFFFFKQKTAYEISSRDWSSDVCSSDLLFAGDSGTGKTMSAEVIAREK